MTALQELEIISPMIIGPGSEEEEREMWDLHHAQMLADMIAEEEAAQPKYCKHSMRYEFKAEGYNRLFNALYCRLIGNTVSFEQSNGTWLELGTINELECRVWDCGIPSCFEEARKFMSIWK